jgi:hypothetical protein
MIYCVLKNSEDDALCCSETTMMDSISNERNSSIANLPYYDAEGNSGSTECKWKTEWELPPRLGVNCKVLHDVEEGILSYGTSDNQMFAGEKIDCHQCSQETLLDFSFKFPNVPDLASQLIPFTEMNDILSLALAASQEKPIQFVERTEFEVDTEADWTSDLPALATTDDLIENLLGRLFGSSIVDCNNGLWAPDYDVS